MRRKEHDFRGNLCALPDRARANPLSLGVWHFTLSFVLPRSGVGYPSRRPKGCGMQLPLGPKVYPKALPLRDGASVLNSGPQFLPQVVATRAA